MKASQEDGGDLFYSPINIDTIDGITRSHTYFTGFSSAHSTLAIARASFIGAPSKDHRILDDFWMMKERVYSGLINDEIGLVSDKTSEIFFLESSVCLSESDLYKSEKSWQQTHKPLFARLNSILKKKSAPSWFSNAQVSFVHRKYFVLPDRDDSTRYGCKKEKKIKSFDIKIEPDSRQYSINLNGIINEH
ncbi:hypothetical protein CU663_05735 [Pseudomonas syringae pv. actinidifoliorum]|nr:hypothetical protein [Pseudomonas syringae pv. actinidifoliorum]